MKHAKIVAVRASHILISKKGMGLRDNSRQIEARIFKIRQKLSEQDPTIIPYLKTMPIQLQWSDFNFE